MTEVIETLIKFIIKQENEKRKLRDIINGLERDLRRSEHVNSENKYTDEITKLKQFVDVFNSILYKNKNGDVEENDLINELVGSGEFTEDESKKFIKEAMHNGQIYERKSGVYAKA